MADLLALIEEKLPIKLYSINQYLSAEEKINLRHAAISIVIY